jgi:hypothetical protein
VTTTNLERQHELRAKKRRKKSSDEDIDVSISENCVERSVVGAGQCSGVGRVDEDSVKQTTLSGGTALIFEMARRMLVWDDELYQGLNDASSHSSEIPSSSSVPTQAAAAANAAAVAALPRWRPKSITQQSISNANPSFRTSSPIMTNAGYASILKRNSRKKNKPSMWRHCLRIYDKMGEFESSGNAMIRKDNNNTKIEIRGVGSNLGPSANIVNTKNNAENRGAKIKVKRSTPHHEAALVAASKLGLWEEAISIYQIVEKASLASSNVTSSPQADGGSVMKLKTKKSRITDNMVLSMIKAAVRGSRVRLKTIQERRIPLDVARDIILSMEDKHDIPLVSRHVNPLASAYLNLGLRSEAVDLINTLNDRKPPLPVSYPKKSKKVKSEVTYENPRFSEGVQLVNWRDDDLDDFDIEDEEAFSNGYGSPQLNIHDVQSKDRGSYSLLVKGAVKDEDWTAAVAELQRMNDAGLHPNSSNLNSWSEVMERGCRPAGKGEAMDDNYYSSRHRRRSWRKRRDGIWLGNYSH